MSTGKPVALPPDPWWLLSVRVKEGAQTPYHLWILWTWQFVRARGLLS